MRMMTMDDLKPGTKIIAICEDYAGLIGEVEGILTGDERVTENDGDVDIVCNLEEVDDMDVKYESLNGTSVCDLAMCMDDIAIIKDDGTALDMFGNIYLSSDLIR